MDIIVKQCDYKIGTAPDKLITYNLSTCVAVALYDPKLKIGGLCHYLLPNDEGFSRRLTVNTFGNLNLRNMLDDLLIKGSQASQLIAKVFGGCSTLEHMGADVFDIGYLNSQTAFKFLYEEKIRIKSRDVGGTSYRTVSFNLDTGRVHVSNKVGMNLLY
ncbi:MAG: chemotaxis protein CheD [Leptospiraceae bacterium]|nr:chemotaxis protein CheD [Leptospiraceae bacterium]